MRVYFLSDLSSFAPDYRSRFESLEGSLHDRQQIILYEEYVTAKVHPVEEMCYDNVNKGTVRGSLLNL